MSNFTAKMKTYSFTGTQNSLSLSTSYQLIWDDIGLTPTLPDVRVWADDNGFAIFDTIVTGVSDSVSIKSRNISMVEDSAGCVWTLDLDCNNEIDQATLTFTSRSYSIDSSIVDRWRVSSDSCSMLIPDSPGNEPEPNVDICGLHIDEGGEPVSWVIPTMQISITNIVITLPTAEFLAGFIATRNNAEFLGVSAGKLLFTGVQVDRTSGGWYNITYQFAADPIYHLRQVAKKGQDNNVILVPRNPAELEIPDPCLCDPTNLIPFTASTVYWKQPFRVLSNFSNIGVVV